MKNILHSCLVSALLSTFLISCSGNKNSAESSVASDSAMMAADTTPYNKKADFKLSFTIANLPSPLDVINTVYTTKVPFDNTLLNPTDNSEKYLNAYKRAINYGIYGVDMAYISYYGNKQDLFDYYATSRKLAGTLGMEKTFEKFSDRFKENSENKDSVLAIVDQAYAETDKYLRTNDRLLTASYIITGSFLESLYISSSLMKNQESGDKFGGTFNKIYEQKLVLNNLAELFKEFKDKEAVALESDLQTIKKVYDELKDPSQINKESLQKISTVVGAARNMAIK
ncbi:MAG: hypothetical protein NT126_09555 [Bacteroidetes bacterium]|nr:hypothetical protein [Bacteroidota bacterium]